MSNYPKHLDATEAKIVDTILDKAIGNDLLVTVGDDVEDFVTKSRDRAEIEDSVGATDHTVLRFHESSDAKQSWLGTVVLIHGNGEDLVSDYSDNEWTNRFVKECQPYC